MVREARSWLHTPYHHRARVKGAGVDCALLLAEVYHAVGLIPRLDPAAYPADWHMHRDVERYLQQVLEFAVPTDTPRPGDVVLYRFGRCVSHGAIVVEWPMVIHAFMREGAVVLSDASRQADLVHPGRFFGAYTLFF